MITGYLDPSGIICSGPRRIFRGSCGLSLYYLGEALGGQMSLCKSYKPLVCLPLSPYWSFPTISNQRVEEGLPYTLCDSHVYATFSGAAVLEPPHMSYSLKSLKGPI